MKVLALLAITTSALVGHLTGATSPQPPTTSMSTPAPAVGSDEHSDCAGGEDALVTTTIAPDSLDDGSLSLALDIHHHFEEGADVIGTIELVDDRGTRVHRTELAARRIAVRGGSRFAYATPRKLADGYYRVLVSLFARGTTSRSEDFSSHESYLHIERGEVTPITSDEWLTQSNDGLVFTKP